MAKARAVTKSRAKKKNWHPIFAPKEQATILLGETYISDPDNALGKTISSNLKNITENLRDQNVYLKFKIVKRDDKNFHTEVVGYDMTTPSIKKLTRRNTTRVDDSFIVETKDGKKVRIKPIAVTLHKTVNSVGTALRLSMKKIIARECKNLTFAELVHKLVTRQFQGSLKKTLAKVYPLRAFHIKALSFARTGKTIRAREQTEEEKLEATEVKEKKKKVKKKKKSVSEEMIEELTGKKEAEEEKKVEAVANAKDSESFGEE